MKIQDCLFLADENVHPELLKYLRNGGFDIISVYDEGLSGAADLDVIEKSVRLGRIIITHDSDFGTHAILRGIPFCGIIYLRPGHIEGNNSIKTVEAVFSRNIDFVEGMIIVAHRQGDTVRIRIRY